MAEALRMHVAACATHAKRGLADCALHEKLLGLIEDIGRVADSIITLLLAFEIAAREWVSLFGGTYVGLAFLVRVAIGILIFFLVQEPEV